MVQTSTAKSFSSQFCAQHAVDIRIAKKILNTAQLSITILQLKDYVIEKNSFR